MKILPFTIPKPLHERLIVQEDKGHKLYDRYHQHQELQISYVVQGTGKLIAAGAVHGLSKDQIVVIGGRVPHVFKFDRTERPTHVISLFFTPNTFGTDFFEMPDLDILKGFFQKTGIGFLIQKPVWQHQDEWRSLAKKSTFDRFIFFLHLLKYLAKAPAIPLSQMNEVRQLSGDDGDRLQKVVSFVMEHFREPIRLHTVADLAYMTPNSFCRFFKKRTNKTFSRFLLELRIAHACQLLRGSSEMPIYEIAEVSGFKSLANFNRKFKTIKRSTPSEYRKGQKTPNA